MGKDIYLQTTLSVNDCLLGKRFVLLQLDPPDTPGLQEEKNLMLVAVIQIIRVPYKLAVVSEKCLMAGVACT